MYEELKKIGLKEMKLVDERIKITITEIHKRIMKLYNKNRDKYCDDKCLIYLETKDRLVY